MGKENLSFIGGSTLCHSIVHNVTYTTGFLLIISKSVSYMYKYYTYYVSVFVAQCFNLSRQEFHVKRLYMHVCSLSVWSNLVAMANADSTKNNNVVLIVPQYLSSHAVLKHYWNVEGLAPDGKKPVDR